MLVTNARGGAFGGIKLVYDFQESLRQSHAAADSGIWLQCYRQFFPTLLACVDHREDGWWQRQGIDRSITLACSKQYLIDEKVRGRNRITGKVYRDIALEVWSDREKNKPGWICKPLLADFICYGILPLGVAYLFPVVSLQKAWCEYGEQWTNSHGEREAKNNGYVTVFVPVPVREVWKGVAQAMRATYDPIEFED